MFNIVIKIINKNYKFLTINNFISDRPTTLFLLFVTLFNISYSQSGVLKGYVKDATSNEEIPFANVFVEQLNSGVATDFDGFFEFKDMKPGLFY